MGMQQYSSIDFDLFLTLRICCETEYGYHKPASRLKQSRQGFYKAAYIQTMRILSFCGRGYFLLFLQTGRSDLLSGNTFYDRHQNESTKVF